MKKYLLLIIIGFLLVIAAVTNPTKESFISWSKDQLKSQSNNSFVNWGIDIFGNSVIDAVTTEQNYLFFTMFDVNLPNKEVKVLGLFQHFIPLPNSSAESSKDAQGYGNSSNLISSTVEGKLNVYFRTI